MTWKLTVRSNPGSTVKADYECPVHGRFEATVARDEHGNPPAEIPCNLTIGCDDEQCQLEHVPCPGTGTWRASAPGAVHVKRGEVVRGKVAEYPGDEYVMDTRPLADGMPLHEFKARRAKVHRDISLRRVRRALGR